MNITQLATQSDLFCCVTELCVHLSYISACSILAHQPLYSLDHTTNIL